MDLLRQKWIKAKINSMQHDFQCDLNAMKAWLCVSRLRLNVFKSTVMLIGTIDKRLTIVT